MLSGLHIYAQFLRSLFGTWAIIISSRVGALTIDIKGRLLLSRESAGFSVSQTLKKQMATSSQANNTCIYDPEYIQDRSSTKHIFCIMEINNTR